MATVIILARAAFESRMLARAECKRDLGPLFANALKVVPLSGGFLVHVPKLHEE